MSPPNHSTFLQISKHKRDIPNDKLLSRISESEQVKQFQ